MVFPTFFNYSLNLAKRSSWSEPQSAPGLVFADCIELPHLCRKENNQSDFGVGHLVMSILITKGELDCWLTRQLRKSVYGRQETPWGFSWCCHVCNGKVRPPKPGGTANGPEPSGKRF